MMKIIKEYFYIVNYQSYEKNLCQLEMKYLLSYKKDKKYIFSGIDISPSRSPFIKHKISIIFSAKTIEEIIFKIVENKISYQGFKVHYIKSEYGDVEYSERLNAVNRIGYVITGLPDMHKPKVNLAITKVNGLWVFGEYEKNDCKWQSHDEKPHSYSNALSTRMARAIINIAVSHKLDLKVIDPCCGVGTVVIEGLDIGVDIIGYEISKSMACNARNNIEFLGYNRERIICGDMHKIIKEYDVAIVDIPYGIFSPITSEEQQKIINSTRSIAKKIILISFEDMDKELKVAGFNILDKTSFSKNRFTRYLTIAN